MLLGYETGDDAAVFKINDDQAVVATTDFFMPIVDDPYDFGRIAATNALSDVYAVGGKPILALAIVGMPVDKMSDETIGNILAGGAAVCGAAGVPVAGGHTIDAPEPIYGLAVVGLVHPDRIKRNDGARAGDVLILGKALGIGILGAALNKDELDEAGYRQMVETATKLNSVGADLAGLSGVHALTDVTGFQMNIPISSITVTPGHPVGDRRPDEGNDAVLKELGLQTGRGNRFGDIVSGLQVLDLM